MSACKVYQLRAVDIVLFRLLKRIDDEQIHVSKYVSIKGLLIE